MAHQFLQNSQRRKQYLKRCQCCGEEYLATNPKSVFKLGHHTRFLNGVSKPQHKPKGKLSGITPPIIFPSLEKALASKPTVCGKCGAGNIYSEHDEELLAHENGEAVVWACFICGWRCFAHIGVPVTAKRGATRRKSTT